MKPYLTQNMLDVHMYLKWHQYCCKSIITIYFTRNFIFSFLPQYSIRSKRSSSLFLVQLSRMVSIFRCSGSSTNQRSSSLCLSGQDVMNLEGATTRWQKQISDCGKDHLNSSPLDGSGLCLRTHTWVCTSARWAVRKSKDRSSK